MREVIPCRYGIEFVIVATGASQGRPKKRLAGDVDHAVENPGFIFMNVWRTVLTIGQVNVSRSLYRLVLSRFRIESRLRKEIPGERFQDKLVVRHIMLARIGGRDTDTHRALLVNSKIRLCVSSPAIVGHFLQNGARKGGGPLAWRKHLLIGRLETFNPFVLTI